MKINLDDRNTVQRLRFDVLHVVHQRGDAALHVAGDALFHFLRLQAGVGPVQRDDGNINGWENVRRRPRNNHAGEKDNNQCHYDERIWPGKC